MPIRSCRWWAAPLTCLLAAALAPAAGAVTPVPVAAHQQIVAVRSAHVIRSSRFIGGVAAGSLAATRPITGQRTVLPVLARGVDERGRAWLQVRLPGRAMGGVTPPKSGWILATGTTAATTAWHLVIDTGRRQLVVYAAGRRVQTFSAIVGAPSTPTPRGEAFVEESVRMPAGAPGAPYALATSARSAVLHEFAGGPGQIAIHGVRNVGGRLGTAVSHGCIRVDDAAITWLATRVGPGVPVTVV